MSHKDEGLKTRHRQYWKKIEADSVVLDPGIIAISWEDSTIRLHDGYTIGGRIFPMSPAPSLTVNVLTPLSGNGSVSSPISLNIAALANQVPVLANAPITGTGIAGSPLDIDVAALAVELANAVPVAHDATLVGNGTAGAPLSVNWGLAPAPTVAHNGTLSGAGTLASPLAVVPAALASQVAVSAISPITGDGKIATPLTLDVNALLPQLHNNVIVVTDGTTITGSGTTANPLVAVPQTATVVTSSPIIGNGTVASPIDINIVSAIAEISAAGGIPVSHNLTITGNGTSGNPLGVDWSQQPALNVQHNGSLTGQGTGGNPLAVNWADAPAINVQHDGTMTGSGTAGSPLSVNALALANQVAVTVAAGLSGNGTVGSPIAANPVVLGPLLSGLVSVAVSAPLTGVGTSASPLGIQNATGASRGVVELATAAEGLQPANDTNATTPAYVAAAVAAVSIADATDVFKGKVALAVNANYPQHANDVDATTPAYVKTALDAAIAAIPADKFVASIGAYDPVTNVFLLSMSDGSTVPVDLTAAVADAVNAVPNKHVAATASSPTGTVLVTAGGTDNQTFTFETNAGIVPIADVAGYFAATNVEAALAELRLAIPTLNFASAAEIQSVHPDKIVTADDLASALSLGINHNINILGAPGEGIRVNHTVGNGAAAVFDNTSPVAGSSALHVQRGGGAGNAAAFLSTSAGAALSLQKTGTATGNALSIHNTTTGWSHGQSIIREGAGLGSGLVIQRLGTGGGYGIEIHADDATPSALFAQVSPSNTANGHGGLFMHSGVGDGTALAVIKSANSATGTSPALYVQSANPIGSAMTVIHNANNSSVAAHFNTNSATVFHLTKNAAASTVGAVVFAESYSAANTYVINAVTHSGAGGTSAVGRFQNTNSSLQVEFATNNGSGHGVWTNGSVFATGGFVPSDKNKKTNIKRIENARDIVSKLNGYRFTWDTKTEEYKIAGDAVQVGLIAQELQEVLPELVTASAPPAPVAPTMPASPVTRAYAKPNEPELAADADDRTRAKAKRKYAAAVDEQIAAHEKACAADKAAHAQQMEMYDANYAAYVKAAASYDSTPRLAVDYSKLVAVLIADNNEMAERIAKLEQAVAKLMVA